MNSEFLALINIKSEDNVSSQFNSKLPFPEPEIALNNFVGLSLSSFVPVSVFKLIPWILSKSKAEAFKSIRPVSGRNKPYEPDSDVYPVPKCAAPSDPLTISYALWVP